jgi:hypothetical protein
MTFNLLLKVILCCVCGIAVCTVASDAPLLKPLAAKRRSDSSGPATEELVLVQILHRHGARSAIVSSNVSLICPTGCGMLNWEGKQQLASVGRYLRQRYNNLPHQAPLFPSESYDPRTVTSRSTNILRTLQSASGLLQGLFPNMSDYFPAISTVDLFTDTLLLTDAIPAYHIYQQLHIKDIETTIVEPQLRKLFNQSTAEAMGVELSIDKTCSNASTFVPCILEAQDIAATYASTGVLTNGSFPVTLSFRPQLQLARFALNSAFFPYNASSELDQARGSLGQNIAMTMIQNMHAKKSGKLAQSLMHYSAHDTTVMPFAATLGNNDLMIPLFGTTYVLELWWDAETKNNLTVRAYAGIPGQSPGNYTIDVENFPLSCMGQDGTVYRAPSYPASCPLEDFERFVNSSRPQSPAGQCYLTKEDFGLIGGNVVGSDQVPTPGSLVAFYRQSCPAQACPLGTFLNANLSCSSMIVVTEVEYVDGNSITAQNAIIIGLATGLGGILMGIVIMKLAPVFWSGNKERYTPVNE